MSSMVSTGVVFLGLTSGSKEPRTFSLFLPSSSLLQDPLLWGFGLTPNQAFLRTQLTGFPPALRILAPSSECVEVSAVVTPYTF